MKGNTMKTHTLTVNGTNVLLSSIEMDDNFNISCTVSVGVMFGNVTRYVEGYCRWTTPEYWDYEVQTAAVDYLKTEQYNATCQAVKNIS